MGILVIIICVVVITSALGGKGTISRQVALNFYAALLILAIGCVVIIYIREGVALVLG